MISDSFLELFSVFSVHQMVRKIVPLRNSVGKEWLVLKVEREVYSAGSFCKPFQSLMVHGKKELPYRLINVVDWIWVYLEEWPQVFNEKQAVCCWWCQLGHYGSCTSSQGGFVDVFPVMTAIGAPWSCLRCCLQQDHGCSSWSQILLNYAGPYCCYARCEGPKMLMWCRLHLWTSYCSGQGCDLRRHGWNLPCWLWSRHECWRTSVSQGELQGVLGRVNKLKCVTIWIEYEAGTGLCFLVTLRTWHLVALNLINQRSSHAWSELEVRFLRMTPQEWHLVLC